jgi:predicted metal-dependent hydrolase
MGTFGEVITVERASAIAEHTIREWADESGILLALALVISGEFANYAIAKTVLETPWALAGASGEVRRLLQWHALEEMEHQSVACDVYRALYGHGAGHRHLHMCALLKACRVLVTAIGQLSCFFSPGFRPWADLRDLDLLARARSRL